MLSIDVSCGDGIPGRRRTELELRSCKPFDDQHRPTALWTKPSIARTSRWFERLLAELGFELWIGDPAEIKAKRVKKQKFDREDARLLLRLMKEDNFPQVWGSPLRIVRVAPVKLQGGITAATRSI